VERVGVAERAHWHHGRHCVCRGADQDHAVLSRQSRTWQGELARERTHLVGADFPPRLAVLAVAVQRDRAANRQERPTALFTVLDPKLLIEQPPPDNDRLAGELGVDLVADARDRQAAVDGDQAPLGLPGEDAEPLPGAHLAHTIGRQVRHPVIDTRMRLGSMVAAVVGSDEACQPAVRRRFGLWLVKVVERLMRFLDRTERPFNLALGARRRSPSVGLGGHVRDDLDAKALHHASENCRLRDWSVVEVDRERDALERISIIRFGRHGIEQEAQRRLGVFAIDAAVLLVGDAGAVIDDGEQHQGRRALPVCVEPRRCLQLLQV
jgi:hypothetical protein